MTRRVTLLSGSDRREESEGETGHIDLPWPSQAGRVHSEIDRAFEEEGRGRAVMNAEEMKTAYVELGKKIGIDIPEMTKRGQASTCMVLAAILEEYLEDAIRAKLPRLSRKRSKRIFGTYGPISNLDAKIEFSHLLEAISDEQRTDANILRGIRNKFAHAKERLAFDSADVIDACKKLSTYPKSGNSAEAAYVLAAIALIDHAKTFRKEPSLFDPEE